MIWHYNNVEIITYFLLTGKIKIIGVTEILDFHLHFKFLTWSYEIGLNCTVAEILCQRIKNHEYGIGFKTL